MNTNIIETNGLTKGSGSRMRVNHIDLRVPEGCVYGFLGPNGAGKTTTLKLLLGLLKPTAGTVTFFGQKMTEKNRLSILKHTGSLIENPSYYGHLTGLENLEIIAKLKKVPASEITNVLQTVRLYEQRDKKVRQYSLGMKQRLGIAMALLGNPRVLILDEPTNGLDPAGIQEIREFIKELPVLRQMTVIVSSHLLGEMEQMADMAGIINHGELIFQGPLATLEARGENLEDTFLKMTEGGESL
ncbi:MAG: ATP-binding cassette domain-containing protein [Lachnospiraceae bacterium]